jgi:hypothetical protein
MQVDDMPEAHPTGAVTAAWRAIKRRVKACDQPRVRDIAVSAMVTVILAIGVVCNLPESAIKRTMSPVIYPIALPVGLDQNWSMYAPDPPRRQEDVEVHVAMADGTERVWTLPRLNPVFGVAFSHRWRKYKESLLGEQSIRPDFAHWVVRELSGPGDRPVHVEMLLRTERIPPPGDSGPGQTAVETLYSENLTQNR